MKKINILPAFVIVFAINIFSQTPDPLSFWPHHIGDVWQYRDAVNNQVVGTRYLDSIYIDPITSDIYIYYRPIGSGTIYKIDSTGRLYNLNFQPGYPRYKLNADSGDSWVAGIVGDDTVFVTITDIYEDYVFGNWTTIKVFTFEIIYSYLPEPFWLGDDHLASGFGWIFTFGEGGTATYLAGAIIDSVQYGTIVSVKNEEVVPDEFIFFQNYPNPFNPLTNLSFHLPNSGNVKITIYDILGKLVITLVDEEMQAGEWTVKWNAEQFSSGVYLAKLDFSGKTQVRKLLLSK